MAAYSTYGTDHLNYDTLEENTSTLGPSAQEDTESALYTAPIEAGNYAGGGGPLTGAIASSRGKPVDMRLADIQEREQAALDLQRELDEREAAMKKGSKKYKPIKNWPLPALGWARNAIAIDIPHQHQKDVRYFYALWGITALSTCFNWICGLWYGVGPGNNDGDMSFIQWAVMTLYIVVGLPCSWMWWYKRFYRAMQFNTPVPQMFFGFIMLHIIWCGIMATGFVLTASFGILAMGKTFADYDDTSLGTAMGINSGLWIISGLLGVYLMKVAHKKLGKYMAKKYLREHHPSQEIQLSP